MSQQTVTVYPITNKTILLYSSYNTAIGKTGSLVTGRLDVASFSKIVFATYIGTIQEASGSLTVSGSFDGTNYFNVTGSAGFFNSGSMAYINFLAPLKSVQVALKNVGTGSAISGSLYILGQS